MPVSAVKTRLGNDVSLWSQLLNEAKAARDVVENSSREKVFGPVIIDYSNVQAKVSPSALMIHQQPTLVGSWSGMGVLRRFDCNYNRFVGRVVRLLL